MYTDDPNIAIVHFKIMLKFQKHSDESLGNTPFYKCKFLLDPFPCGGKM